jgi:hypothetical protein
MDYQGVRVGRIADRLRNLSEDDQEDVIRLLHKLNCLLERPA